MLDGHRAKGSRVCGLERRLDTDTLTPGDRERLKLTQRLRALRREGKTLEECGAILGQHPKTLGHFMRRGVYKVLCDYLERVERGEDAQAIERMVRWARTEFVKLAPYAIEYFKSCFERNPPEEWAERGRWKDDAKARWAAQFIAKGLGLLDPQHVARPVIHISATSIRAELEEIAADDAKAEAAWCASTVIPKEGAGLGAVLRTYQAPRTSEIPRSSDIPPTQGCPQTRSCCTNGAEGVGLSVGPPALDPARLSTSASVPIRRTAFVRPS